MAAPRIIRTRSAENDLTAIWDYLAAEASPEIADFVLARLFEAMNRAAQFPLMYPQTEYGEGTRRVNVFEYAIFYKPLLEGDGIRVRRVIHGRRNIVRLLRRT
jgi:plasmid stabilization system protein ParE